MNQELMFRKGFKVRTRIYLVLALMAAITFYCTMASAQSRCIATVKAGTQCTRKAVIDGYCKQHYSLKTSKPVPSKPKINLPEEWPEISTNPAKPDVMVVWRDPNTNVIYVEFKH